MQGVLEVIYRIASRWPDFFLNVRYLRLFQSGAWFLESTEIRSVDSFFDMSDLCRLFSSLRAVSARCCNRCLRQDFREERCGRHTAIYRCISGSSFFVCGVGCGIASAPIALTIATLRGIDELCGEAVLENGLTPRESEILPYLAKGYDRGFIASELTISVETVRSHTRHIYGKFDVHTRVELLNAIALRGRDD